MIIFKPRYFICAIVIFVIEVIIALFVEDQIIRPYIGDILVVILIYTFLRSFFAISVVKLAVITLLFAYLIELLQYFKIVELLGLQDYPIARAVIGTFFSWIDILCYTLGFVVVLVTEEFLLKNKQPEATT